MSACSIACNRTAEAETWPQRFLHQVRAAHNVQRPHDDAQELGPPVSWRGESRRPRQVTPGLTRGLTPHTETPATSSAIGAQPPGQKVKHWLK